MFVCLFVCLFQISFNVDMLRASPEARFTEIDSSLLPDALTTMEDMIKQLQHRRQKNNLTFPKTHPEYEEDPYLSLGADQHPEFMAFDTYMYPVVTMSLLLSAAAERALLTAPFTTALAIESSNMDPSFDNSEGGMRELRTIEMKFRTALHAVEHCLPQQVLDATPYSLVAAAGPADEGASLLGSLGGSIGSGSVDGRAGGGRGGDSVVSELGAGEAAFNNSAQDDAAAAARGNPFQSSAVQAMGFANSPLLGVGVAVAGDSAVVTSASGAAARGGGGGVAAGTSTLSSTAPSEQDIPDISVLKDYAKNYTLVSALRGGEAEAKPISRNALQKLRQEFNIDLCPQTGLVGTIQLDSLESAKGVGGASDSSPAAGTSSKGKEKGKKGSKTTASKEDKPQDKSQDKSQEKSGGGGAAAANLQPVWISPPTLPPVWKSAKWQKPSCHRACSKAPCNLKTVAVEALGAVESFCKPSMAHKCTMSTSPLCMTAAQCVRRFCPCCHTSGETLHRPGSSGRSPTAEVSPWEFLVNRV